MLPRPRPHCVLLLFAGAALFFGGGVGCSPVLEGVNFRAGNVLTDPTDPRDWFMAFNGKKAPGNGRAQLPYAVQAPFGVSARMGVFVEDLLLGSADAEGCIGFRDTGSSEEYRLCVTYQVPANVHVFSNLDGETADCADATRAELDLDDDGVNVVARFRCPGDVAYQELATAPSLWGMAEKWNAFVSAEGLRKGGQVAFDDFRIDSPPLLPGSDPASIAFQTFDAFRLGMEAFYEIEGEDFDDATVDAGDAYFKLVFAVANLSPAFAEASDADKLLSKAASSHAKLYDALLGGGVAKYQKGFAKTAAADANALEALAPGF
jgi:hypothetical protein